MKIYAKNRELPPYAFIPGKNKHPEKEGGHYFGTEISVSLGQKLNLEGCQDFYHGVDLFNHGYPWEAHVWWEALWNELARKGHEALLLQSLIKLAAAKVKLSMKDEENALIHWERAIEILGGIIDEGFNSDEIALIELLAKLKETKPNLSFMIELQGV